jgi:hypothetical protein
MVPVTGGEWAEVRTIALGAVEQDAEGDTHTSGLRYFSRLCSAATFIDWVDLPLYEAGTARAGTVDAVQDGADWLSQLLDAHCPDAVRILDFPHAAEYLTKAAQAALGAGTAETSSWLDTWFHTLKHGNPDAVIAAVRALPAPSVEAAAIRDGAVGYLSRRRRQIAYADFQHRGYPIGSGIVESANKLVVEHRLKGAGMSTPSRSGSRRNVTPMLALRAVLCNGEWDAVWPALWQHLCDQAHARSRQRWCERRRVRQEQEQPSSPAPPTPILPKDPPMMIDGHPTDHHHWKHGYDQQLLARAQARAIT